MLTDYDTLKSAIEHRLGQKVLSLSQMGQGMCNTIWYADTYDQQTYLVKQERLEKYEEEQNNLVVEGNLLKTLNEKNPLLPIPQIIFVCENPRMYGYRYAPGRMMSEAWADLTEAERTSLCEQLGQFHYELGNTLTEPELIELALLNNKELEINEETDGDLLRFLDHPLIPETYQDLVLTIYHTILDTNAQSIFRFCHNDSHHENILLVNGQLACVIDFGDADFGDVHREFSRYVLDYPDYYDIIVRTYERLSNTRLSRQRIIALSIMDTLGDLFTGFFFSGKIDLLDRNAHWFKT
ncbi:hypothetical protein GCM10023187_33860 [Nibrella viscosa]|uniref:Aminoglycoside phosphotransferase domain-containing protein n=1 Tax=Nibrella viscosa TaxID=1084524 RepID=A0ABP8KL73_9BACT